MAAAISLYRPCVGIALFNAERHVFVGERLDNPGAWQMPQGGIEVDEDIEAAVLRELKEEIGSDKAEIVHVHKQKLRYKLPTHLGQKLWGGQYVGQEQTWVAAKFTGSDADIDIAADGHPEFGAWKWIPFTDIVDTAVSFKRDTYQQVYTALKDIILP